MTTTTRILAAAFALAATVTIAGASDHRWGRDREEDEEHEPEREHDGPRRVEPARAEAPSADPGAAALYRKECGACHLAFPPGLLPAESHRRLLGGLDRHFGQNAELDPATSARLERYLVENAAEAGTHRKSGKVLASTSGAAPLRLTETPYFRRKHRELRPDVIARPAVRTLANCGACHAGAKDWDFDEDRVKIPR